MFKRMLKMVTIAGLAIVMSACSRVTVPPAHLGKVLSGSGYSPELKQPGKYWLYWWENMILLDTSTNVQTEPITIRMADDLELSANISFRGRIHGDEGTIQSMFNDIVPHNDMVTFNQIYGTYGRDVIQSTARTVLNKYKITEIASNYDRATEELQVKLAEKLQNSPIALSNVTLQNIVFPSIITDALNAQKDRELAIQTEENRQAVKMKERENQLRLAEADASIRKIQANAIRAENEILASGLNPLLLEYRRLEVIEKMAENERAVFFPIDMVGNQAIQNRVMSTR